MEIRVLRYFLAIAREGSITNAANYLHLSQPTLSRQISELEEQLGQQLFLRKSRSMVLTAEGMVLRKRAEEIVAMVDKTEAEFSAMENTVAGDIYIGGGETDAMKLVADILWELRREYPDLRFHIHSGNAEDVTERLDKGLLDFGLLIHPVDYSKYEYIKLPAKDTWGIVMRKDSPLAQQDAVLKEDLLDAPLIFSRQAMAHSLKGNELTNWFGVEPEKLNINTTFNLFYNAAIMVDAGLGYAVTLDKLANTSESSNLTFRPLEPRLESDLVIVWKKYPVFSVAAEKFLEKLQEKYGNIQQ